jgi:formamidopyrimidine-DNA glycosylase
VRASTRGARRGPSRGRRPHGYAARSSAFCANEALWRARIDPARPARTVTRDEAARLRAAVVDVLHESIAARGTSFRDYRDATGARGAFIDRLVVYGRTGQPCARCGATLIGTHDIDGRSTVLCARCQG